MLQRYFLIYYIKYFGESALEKIEIIAERIHALRSKNVSLT